MTHFRYDRVNYFEFFGIRKIKKNQLNKMVFSLVRSWTLSFEFQPKCREFFFFFKKHKVNEKINFFCVHKACSSSRHRQIYIRIHPTVSRSAAIYSISETCGTIELMKSRKAAIRMPSTSGYEIPALERSRFPTLRLPMEYPSTGTRTKFNQRHSCAIREPA